MSVLQSDDVIVEATSSLSASGEEDFEETGDSENDIRELKARRHALANKLAQQQKRRDKIQVKQADWFNLKNHASKVVFSLKNLSKAVLNLPCVNILMYESDW